MSARTERSGWTWCALAAVLFGAATPVTKLLVGRLSPATLAGLLYLGAAAAVAPVAVREPRPTAGRRQRVRLSIAVGLGGGLAPVLLVLALRRTPAASVSLFLNLELVATALIARTLLHEHIGRRAGFGIVVVALGGVLLAGSSHAGVLSGTLLVAGACACWGIDNAITASLDGFTPAQITLAKGLAAGSVNLLVGVVAAGAPSLSAAGWALVVGGLGYGVSIAVWITGARLIGAARGQAVFALAPFVGALLAWPITGEHLTAASATAFAVSLTGVAIVATGHHTHSHVHEVTEHRHPFTAGDVHHGAEAISLLGDGRHRHRALDHDHEHLPDLHHRHVH